MHRIPEDVLKNLPIDLSACFGKGAAVDRFGFRPKTATSGVSEEVTRFRIHALAFSAGSNREYEGDELWEGEFVVAGEIFGGLFL